MNLSCVIYIRVSDEKQTRGASLNDQERSCRAFAAAQGLKVIHVYRDDGKSAWKDDVRHRPQFEQLLAAARHPRRRFGAVVVFKLDRFARKARIYHVCRWELEKVGVRLLSATEPNEQSAAGRLSSGMLAQFAEFYSDQLSERIKASAAGKAARGEWVGPAPFGYELVDRQLRPSRLRLWVVLIFIAYREGRSTVTIAGAMNAARIPMRSGRPWTKDTVLMILRNPAYIGLAGGRALGAYQAGHTPLITRELWDEVATALNERRRRPRGPNSKLRAAPLAWRPRCAICDGPMHRHTHKIGYVLHCYGAINKVCPAKGVKFDLVRDQVDLLLKAGTPVSTVWIRAPRGVERWE